MILHHHRHRYRYRYRYRYPRHRHHQQRWDRYCVNGYIPQYISNNSNKTTDE